MLATKLYKLPKFLPLQSVAIDLTLEFLLAQLIFDEEIKQSLSMVHNSMFYYAYVCGLR